MRRDMKDLVVNTGRSRGWSATSHRRASLKRDPLYWLATQGKMGRNKWLTELGDRLSPLYRWLESNCGRPWDDVYSEFCAVTDRRSIRGHHLWTHLDGYVNWGQHYPIWWRRWTSFYMDEEGILQQDPRG